MPQFSLGSQISEHRHAAMKLFSFNQPSCVCASARTRQKTASRRVCDSAGCPRARASCARVPARAFARRGGSHPRPALRSQSPAPPSKKRVPASLRLGGLPADPCIMRSCARLTPSRLRPRLKPRATVAKPRWGCPLSGPEVRGQRPEGQRSVVSGSEGQWVRGQRPVGQRSAGQRSEVRGQWARGQ